MSLTRVESDEDGHVKDWCLLNGRASLLPTTSSDRIQAWTMERTTEITAEPKHGPSYIAVAESPFCSTNNEASQSAAFSSNARAALASARVKLDEEEPADIGVTIVPDAPVFSAQWFVNDIQYKQAVEREDAQKSPTEDAAMNVGREDESHRVSLEGLCYSEFKFACEKEDKQGQARAEFNSYPSNMITWTGVF
ncbi:hypothetical protein CONPUDRAFT_71284 [Coniophora puteana RWD-64-598 SS2]|uniref:Uncharacterized protein n=1 Tax=Coniophora puteana (strain RWD-64-598) TaxID=741705 RepID=A0A5M3MZE6_CONPW|nr:uncharacterized protein CONPUDRAFT_71284 [Coniophora puteana RWD-64-598 SS2]EIW84543.1 hypothetical protein CONPUDRAFT_71284 [Coniophora puteana RWD-64-598 SS2]